VLSGIAAYVLLVVVDMIADDGDCRREEDNRNNKHWGVTKGQYTWPVRPMIYQLQ